MPNIENPETIYQVDSVIVFGSFATECTADVGDLDGINLLDEVSGKSKRPLLAYLFPGQYVARCPIK